MGDREQLKILDEKFLERKHLLSAIIERFLDNKSYYGLSFTSLMENASSSIAAFVQVLPPEVYNRINRAGFP